MLPSFPLVVSPWCSGEVWVLDLGLRCVQQAPTCLLQGMALSAVQCPSAGPRLPAVLVPRCLHFCPWEMEAGGDAVPGVKPGGGSAPSTLTSRFLLRNLNDLEAVLLGLPEVTV